MRIAVIYEDAHEYGGVHYERTIEFAMVQRTDETDTEFESRVEGECFGRGTSYSKYVAEYTTVMED